MGRSSRQYEPEITRFGFSLGIFRASNRIARAGGATRLVSFCLTLLACCLSPVAFGQISDSFEGGNPRWKLVDWDCDAKIRLQEISPQIPHSGLTCEVLELRMARGTLAVLGYPIRESLVLEEFKPSIWVRSTQRGATIGVRVVFRNAIHPVTGKPREIWIWGDAYGAIGSWQRIQLTGLPQKLGEKVRALRSEFGNNIDWGEAVVDCVAINAYSNSGIQVLQLDDLEIVGLIDAPKRADNSKASPDSEVANMANSPGRLATATLESGESENAAPTISNSGDIDNRGLTTNRWLQYQGESLEWLASIGIKGIILSAPPTQKELEQAENYGLKVISPLPTVVPLQQQAKDWSIVEGWAVGNYSDRQEYEVIRQRVEQLRGSMSHLQKPIVAEPIENLWAYSRISNTLVLPCLQAGAYERSTELTEFLEDALKDCRGSPQVMASLATQPSLEWRRQVEAMGEIIGQPTINMTTGDPCQIRSQMYRALAAGVQGMYFRSRSPLDTESNEDRARANMLQWIHAELDLISPWLNTSRGSRHQVQANDSNWDATLWESPKSQLIVVQPSGPNSHLSFASSNTPNNKQPLKLTWQQSSPSAQVMRFTQWKLETLPQRRIGGVVEVQIDNPHTIEFLISTSEPQVLSYFNQRFEVLGAGYAFAVANVAQMRLAAAQEIVAARWQVVSNNRLTEDMLAIQRAGRDMEQAYLLLGSNTPGAMAYILRALEASQLVIHNAWSVARADVPSPQSAPWLLASSSVPLHWYLGRKIGNNSWSDLALAGGAMENLEVMLTAGWKQDRRLEDQVDVLTEVVSLAPEGPGNALRIVARGKEREISGGYAGSSLRIRSGALNVTAGQVIRIEGRVKVQAGCNKPQSGLLVYESMEGPALGQLLKAPQNVWLPLRIYRVVERSGPLEIMLEMRGEGDVLIDDLTVAAANFAPLDPSGIPTAVQTVP